MKKIYYFLMAAFVAIDLSACDKDAEVYDLLPDDETENPDNGNNNGNNSDGENNSEDYDVWSSVSFKVAPGITFGGRYTIVPQKKGTDYYFYMQSHGETMKDYFIVLTQDLTSADGKRIYEVTTSDKIPVDAYFPSDYADEVSITENKATVVFVIGSVKDSQTIVLKN